MENLIKIQSELKAPKNQLNKFGNYNYRSCEDILEALKPLLKENGCTLIITDEVKEINGFLYTEATCRLSNGKEVIEVKSQAGINPDRRGMDIAQCFGASSSYARKYALNGLFLIDDTKDPDHTNTHGKEPKESVKVNPQYNEAMKDIEKSTTVAELQAVWDFYTPLQKSEDFIKRVSEKKMAVKQ